VSHSRILLYPLGADHAQQTQPLYFCLANTTQKTMTHLRLRVYWSVSRAGRCADDIENTASSIVAGRTVFTELLPANALIKSVTL
jgi:hypothetical protein